MSQKVASKRSLSTLKKDNDDVAKVDEIAKKNKVAGRKSGSNDNDGNDNCNDNGGNDKNENKENKEDKDVAFDVNTILEDVDQVTSEKSVTGLKELKALKNDNELEYINESALLYHVVPQFPQTREKDNEMEVHLIDPNDVAPARYYITDEDRAVLLPYMLDNTGDMVTSNIDWDIVDQVMYNPKGDAQLHISMLLKCIESYYDDENDDGQNNFVGDGHANANSVEGIEFDTFDQFVVAFENLLTQSKSFLEKNSNEPVKIYVEVIGEEKTNIHLINYFPN